MTLTTERSVDRIAYVQYLTGVYMRQHKDLVVNDAGMGKSIDSPLKQIKLRTSTVATEKRRDIDSSRTAEFLLKSRAIMLEHFQSIASGIDDMSWYILLDLTTAENSRKLVTAHDLAITHNMAVSTMSRYVDYLVRLGLLVKGIDVRNDEKMSLKLTASGEAMTSTALRNISRELADI